MRRTSLAWPFLLIVGIIESALLTFPFYNHYTCTYIQQKTHEKEERNALLHLVGLAAFVLSYEICMRVLELQCIFCYFQTYLATLGCSGKRMCHNSRQPLPRLYRCTKPSKLSTQCECTGTSIGWYFLEQPMAAECWRGRGGKLPRIFVKKHNI